MIDFRPFYQQIATSPLSAWLETLPAQLKQWEKQTHSDYAKWAKIVDFLPDLHANQINLKSAVQSEGDFELSAGERQRIIYHLKQLMPWRKGLIIFMAFILIANGVLISNGIACCLTLPHSTIV